MHEYGICTPHNSTECERTRMNWNDVCKELCLSFRVARPFCASVCLFVSSVCSVGGGGVMNKNRLSFEPDDLQNNEATVLEQIYSLITCRRLLYACALFLRFLQQPAPHPNVLPIRPWPGAFSILMEKGPSNRFGLWLVCDRCRRPCSVLTYCQWHYIYVHISVHTINVCSFLHYLNRKTLAVDRWT